MLIAWGELNCDESTWAAWCQLSACVFLGRGGLASCDSDNYYFSLGSFIAMGVLEEAGERDEGEGELLNAVRKML